MKYIDEHRELYGVEPICEVLQVAPSTFYAAASRPPSARQLGDERLKVDIVRVHKENFNVYGAWKLWRQLNREGIPVGRDHVARLMPELGLVGTVRGKVWPTTFPAEVGQRPADLVDRKFMAVAPNRLWVADLTYVSTWACIAYTAFVTDVFSRYIVGWKVSTSLRAELAMDALEMAIWARRRARPQWSGSSLRPRRAVPRHSVHRASRGRRRGVLSRFSRRLLRQRPGRVRQRSLQDRGRPQAGAMAVIRTARAGHC